MQVIGGIMLFSGILVAAVLFLRRRWELPFGSITLMCSLLAVLFPFFTEFRNLHLIVALIVTGLLIDGLIQWLTGDVPATPVRARILGALIPLAIWIPYELSIAIADGLGWEPTVYLGMLSTTAGVGFGVALIMFPPSVPAAMAAETEV